VQFVIAAAAEGMHAAFATITRCSKRMLQVTRVARSRPRSIYACYHYARSQSPWLNGSRPSGLVSHMPS